jgi:hydroxymethylpyrimidine pyrophosphatase-like HAD family hydrolase
MFRIIASDIDGPLLRSDASISPRTLSVLDECTPKGTRFVIATGRVFSSASTVLPPEIQAMPRICCNGA